MSDAAGLFGIDGLAPGAYHLVVNVTGFAPSRTEFTVAAGAVVDAGDIALTPALHYTEVLSVAPTSRNQFETYQPTSVLAGQDLSLQLEGSLGATLSTQPGIAERSFGPGPSRPVIRGLDGDRVLILEDGARTGDLSSQSGDHGVAANPAAASKLEVVRGPATLLYGANAIGGLVNVITEIIPTHSATGTSGTAQFDFGSSCDRRRSRSRTHRRQRALGDERRWQRAGPRATCGRPSSASSNSQSRSAIGNVGVARTGDKGYLGASYQVPTTRGTASRSSKTARSSSRRGVTRSTCAARRGNLLARSTRCAVRSPTAAIGTTSWSLASPRRDSRTTRRSSTCWPVIVRSAA